MKAHKIITLLLILCLFTLIMEAESRVRSAFHFVVDKVALNDPPQTQPKKQAPLFANTLSFFHNN